MNTGNFPPYSTRISSYTRSKFLILARPTGSVSAHTRTLFKIPRPINHIINQNHKTKQATSSRELRDSRCETITNVHKYFDSSLQSADDLPQLGGVCCPRQNARANMRHNSGANTEKTIHTRKKVILKSSYFISKFKSQQTTRCLTNTDKSYTIKSELYIKYSIKPNLNTHVNKQKR